jgi:hypothetical protein
MGENCGPPAATGMVFVEGAGVEAKAAHSPSPRSPATTREPSTGMGPTRFGTVHSRNTSATATGTPMMTAATIRFDPISAST